MSIRKAYPMQAYKIMHGLWGMGQMLFTKYLVGVDDDVDVHNTSEVLFRLCANTAPSAIQFSQNGRPMFWTMQPLKLRWEQS